MSQQWVWDFWAKRYDHLWVQKYSLRPTRRKILQHLRGHLERESGPDKIYRILDVGCGTGQLLRDIKAEFAEYPLELLGIDYSKQMITLAKEYGDEIEYQQMDVSDISSLPGKFDSIICSHSFPYYTNQAKTIRELGNLLELGGHLLLAQASQNNGYDQVAMFFVKLTTGKAKYLSVNEVISMTEASFRCEEAIQIKEKWYMPSIYFFILAKR